MKNIFKIAFAAIIGFLLISCEKDEDRAVIGTPGTSDLSMTGTSFVLNADNASQKATTFSWINPSYGLNVEVKSSLQLAKAGTNFAKIKEVALTSGAKTMDYTVQQLNAAALELGLPAAIASDVEVRLASNVPTQATIYSKTIKFTVTPYLTSLDFYLVGAATAAGWSDSQSLLLSNQDNTSVIYTYLKSGENFRFLGQKSWNPINYSIDLPETKAENRYFKTVSSNVTLGDNENMKFTGATGVYKVEIDSKEKSLNISASPVAIWNPANVYIVGSVNNWDAGNPLEMKNTSEGVFEYTIALPNDAQFKFIGQKSWGDLDWGNFPKDGNSGYLAPKGSNGNIKFDGGGATYKITVDIKKGIYTIEK
ncbi:SusE domain-containing protein [Elizabethkingia sp. HX XZB]|uniref:SusE domain-containing protein n=1 Tax=Elizabethkingia sp. HX XZB TaxID=3003193 RepID=UPI002A24A758|nr:SusE domain-containing protein [Elizabethkingia sp. HX XZB]MDX8567500.1 SusE domain-containing protein [Elizabethkingia sp. HX XZB]